MKTPITYYGGKQTLSSVITAMIPHHEIYSEPYFGGGAVFFAKPPSKVEIINDVNGEVINFYKVIKTDFTSLQKEIIATPHSRELFKKARVVYENPELFSEVKRAWAFWTLTNQGFSGMVTSWGFGKTNSKEVSLAKKREEFSNLYEKRLSKTQIECNDALKVIERSDSPDTFFYLDPPYFNSHQGHYKGFTEEDYEKLLEVVAKLKGKFLLSSYPSKVLDRFIKKHKWQKKAITKSVAVTKNTDKVKTEMLVFNYPLPKEEKSPSIVSLTKSLKNLKIAA
jgi:DNA adenine methylase